MPNNPRREIEAALQEVARLRGARASDSGLALRVAAIKGHQHARFQHDYAELLASARYGAATRFFLEDLYGPMDFTDRDTQFERVVAVLARLLPSEVMQTVADLAELHALSEGLDQQMAHALGSDTVGDRSYREAWLAVGLRTMRERQLILLTAVGTALERHTRTPLLAATLRLMRHPARAAGLSALQSFLERGLAAFTAMHGAAEFLMVIATNERRVMDELFSAGPK